MLENGNGEPLLCYPLIEPRDGGELYVALAWAIQDALEHDP